MANAHIDRIEPPFWWEGMQRESLQIMFYGNRIADYEIISSKGLKISEVKKIENPNYLFLTIETVAIKADLYQFTFKKEGSPTITQEYTIKKRRENSALRKSFDSSDLVYLLMPDRFASANSNNNHSDLTEKINRNSLHGRHGGDIKGIIEHLDYLEDLGVTALWCTPLCEDNDAKYSYHGYAQSDVYTIDKRFGSNEDYLKLSEELHKRGMKLIKDYVTNHWGLHHYLIKDLPEESWINQWEKFTATTHRATTQIDPYAADIDHKIHESGWFVPSMADLNQKNPEVLNYLIQNVIWWIEYADLDGIRVDTFPYNDKEAIANWNKAILKEYPNLNIVGEIWLYNTIHLAYWQKDSKVAAIQNYNSHLPAVMDFALQQKLSELLSAPITSNHHLVELYDVLVNDFLYSDPHNLMVFFDNHDLQRFNTLVKGDFKSYQLALTVICTTRGIPQLYYGSEIGMQGDKNHGDGDIRHEFPGGWEGDRKNAFLPSSSKNGRNSYQEQYHAFSKKLFTWRKYKTVLHTGKLLHYIPEDNVYVYFRFFEEGDRIMIVLNTAITSKSVKLERFKQGIAGKKRAKEISTDAELSLGKFLKIPARTSLILELY